MKWRRQRRPLDHAPATLRIREEQLVVIADLIGNMGAPVKILEIGATPKRYMLAVINVFATMLDWMLQPKQTAAEIDGFWQVVLVSALNENLDRTDAHYGIWVFWKAFLSNSAGFGMGVPAVPLADLFASCAETIARSGGVVRTRCSVGELCASNGSTVTGV